jgi:hypothetical protein
VRTRVENESFKVGLLPVKVLKCVKVKFVAQITQIIKLDENAENEVKRQKGHWNRGVTSFCLLEDMQEFV